MSNPKWLTQSANRCSKSDDEFGYKLDDEGAYSVYLDKDRNLVVEDWVEDAPEPIEEVIEDAEPAEEAEPVAAAEDE